jgi:hypothetical protein
MEVREPARDWEELLRSLGRAQMFASGRCDGRFALIVSETGERERDVRETDHRS